HHLLRVAEAVHGGGVDPVDAALDGMPDGGHRLGVVLAAPAEGPSGPADGPGAEAHAADLHARRSQRCHGPYDRARDVSEQRHWRWRRYNPSLSMTLTAGARLGPYEVLDALGSGGMGRSTAPAIRASAAPS